MSYAHHRIQPLCRLLPWLLLAVLVWLRPFFEHTMTRQMLVHIPLIVLTGVWVAAQWPRAGQSRAGRWVARSIKGMNAYGAPGLLYASLTGMFWMIPKALDDVLLHGWVAFGKFASLLLAGMVLRPSWQRAHPVIRLFFLGGFCWTSAIAGMLYQESTDRLCNFYLLDDQVWAGRGLVILAVLLPAWWAWVEAVRHLRRTRQAGQPGPEHH